jgi:hypothetical protein
MPRLIVAALVTCVLTATTPTAFSDAERYLEQFIDRTVSPRDDFFHYAVGKWLREHRHEITHGCDDEGRQFDEKGNLQNWWTPGDEKEFNRRAQRIIKQYNRYVAVGTLHVNGAATQGENIADLGGINLAWDAFTKTDQYRRGAKIGGLTPAQRFHRVVVRLDEPDPTGEPCGTGKDRRSRAKFVPGNRAGVEHGAVLRGVWREAW